MGDREGVDVGVGVVVSGERSVRGMELVTRSEARVRVFVSFEGGGCAIVGEWGGRGGGRASWAASSHAERAEGSTGQVEGGESAGEEWIWLEEVFPMMCLLGSSQKARYYLEVRSKLLHCLITSVRCGCVMFPFGFGS